MVTHLVTQMKKAPVDHEGSTEAKLLCRKSGGRGTRTPKGLLPPHFEGPAAESDRTRFDRLQSEKPHLARRFFPQITRNKRPQTGSSVTHLVTHVVTHRSAP